MTSVWRITKQKHAKIAFTGDGARVYGGRWNSPGKLVVYTAESRALALAEILVHLESARVLSKYFAFQVEIDKSHIAHLGLRELPKNWRAEPASKRLQTLGDEWLDSGNRLFWAYRTQSSAANFSKLRITTPRDSQSINDWYSSHLGSMAAYNDLVLEIGL